MNAIDQLKLDHRVVGALFQKAMNESGAKRGATYKKISNELAAHAHIEEKIFYPALLKDGKKDLKKIVLEGIEEHGQIHMFHDQLDTMKPTEEKFEPKMTVLQEDIRHRVKEEENEMFDMVESQFSSEKLEQLGEEMEAERNRFQKAKGIPKRSAADTALGQGMLTRMIDAVTGLFAPSEDSPKQKRGSNGASRKASGGSKAPSGNGSSKSSTKSAGASKSTKVSNSAAKSATGSRSGKTAGSGKSSGKRATASNGGSTKSSPTKASGSAKTRARSSARSGSSK